MLVLKLHKWILPLFPFPFLVLKCYVQKVPSTLSERTLPHMCSPYKILASISFYINVPFTGHIYPFISTFFACIYVELSLVITYFNATRKGRIYYWNIFGLSLCSVCQDNIGHRLLQKHGWKLGQGLGKTLQGKCFKFAKMNESNVYEANLVPRCFCCPFRQDFGFLPSSLLE